MLQTLSQITAGIAGILSLLALGLATIGIYGVVTYVVSRRRREVAVRVALGAGARDVPQLILRQTLRPVAVGMAIGIAIAAVSARVLQSVLFGVSPYDPVACRSIRCPFCGPSEVSPASEAVTVNPFVLACPSAARLTRPSTN